ncbi:MAG: GrpB family protein [Chloroflexota bacterium]
MMQFKQSDPVTIIPYQARWVDEFQQIGTDLRHILGKTAVRIDHIGSTAVPQLPAKDIIDIQITVTDLEDPALLAKLRQSKYQMREAHYADNYLGIADDNSPELQKRYCREAVGERCTHIHIRQNGRFNQQYPLLFRDYLRSHEIMRQGYATLKNRLAEIFPDSIEGYLYIKDPLMDMIFATAQDWAKTSQWQPDENFL